MDGGHDDKLILRYRDGDEEALRLLLTRWEGYIYQLCFRFAGEQQEALDLTQETLLKVLTGLEGFQAGRPFKPWLRKVTVNVCLNALRRRGPGAVSLEEPVAEGVVLGDTLVADTNYETAAE